MSSISNAILESTIGQSTQRVTWVNNRFQNCLTALEPRRERLFSDLEKYAGYQLNLGQIKDLDKRGRIAIVMNIATRKVQGLAAAMLKNVWDINYSPMDGKRNSLHFALEDMLEIDKDYSNWRFIFLQHIIYGLINDSCMEMRIKNAQDPLGRISWELCQPGSFAYDPNWKTGISNDLEWCFKYSQMRAEQLLQLFPDITEKVRHAMLADTQMGGNFDSPRIDDLKNYMRSKTLNGLYNVIEYNYLQEEETIKEVAISDQGTLTIPQTDDVAFKRAFIEANRIPYEDVKSITMTVRKAKIITICPDLVPDEPLYDGYDLIQIERLRFFPFSAERIVGEPRGIMSIIGPMQDAINKVMNNVQDIIDSSAHGGGAVDPAIVNNDGAMMKKIVQHWAEPSFKFWSAVGALKSGQNFFAEFPQSKVDPQIFVQFNNLINELNNDMLPINPASEGKSEHAQEPGIVFNMKMQAIEQAQLCVMTNVENFQQEMGEAYLDAAKEFYSKNRRVFYKNNGEQIVINDVKVLENGDIAIDNDIASIQKCRTVVTLSPHSPNARFTQRMTQMDLLNLLMKDPQDNAELIAISQAKLLDTVEYDDEEEKMVAEASQRRLQLAKMKIDAQLNPRPQQSQKPPSISIGMKDLPPEGQVQAAKMAGIDIGPQQQQQQTAGQQPQANPMIQNLQQQLQPLTNPQHGKPA